MKKAIFITLLFYCVGFANAQTETSAKKEKQLRDLPVGNQKDEGAKVPEVVKINFDKAYPKNIAAWTLGEKNYMAEYKDSLHMGHIVTYDQYGKQLTLQQQLSPGAFPVPIDKYIEEHYPNEHFTIWSMVNDDGTNLFYFTRFPETIWFDPTGNFRNTTKNKLK